jgi:hypothetical protein
MVAGSESLSSQTRASQLIAEALVEGHDREVIVQRARSMGLSRGLTDVVVAACPCGPTVGNRRKTTVSNRAELSRRLTS